MGGVLALTGAERWRIILVNEGSESKDLTKSILPLLVAVFVASVTF